MVRKTILLLAAFVFVFMAVSEAVAENNGQIVEEVDPWMNPRNWVREHGYDITVYGETSADLSPVSDYLSILEEHWIFYKPKELLISHKDGYEYISSEVNGSIWLLYLSWNDGLKMRMVLQVPRSYKPAREAMMLLIASVLSTDEDKAEKMLASLEYNVVDGWCTVEAEDYTVDYYEPTLSNGSPASFYAIYVEKRISE